MGGMVSANRSLSSQSSFPPPSSSLSPALSPSLFQYGPVIGRGGFGQIREIQRKKDQQLFALKEFHYNRITSHEKTQILLNEFNALKSLGSFSSTSSSPSSSSSSPSSSSHPFIVQFYGTLYDSNSISFVLELLNGGDARLSLQRYKRYTEKMCAYVIGCIGSALRHLHQHQIIHRDVKPENIMFNQWGVPKLIDFGISYTLPMNSKVCLCQYQSGTREYLAPEVLVSKTHYHGYESDFWSLGIVLYELLFWELPYIPDSLTKYSQETYESVWNSVSKIGIDATVVSWDTSGLNFLDEVSNRRPEIEFSSLLTHFDCPEPVDYTIHIPEINSATETTSESCRDLLLSLLDVRIHRRVGVGEKYEQFSSHFWFSSHFNLESLPDIPSPISINVELVEDQIRGKFDEINSPAVSFKPISSASPPKELSELIHHLHYVSPLFDH